MKYAAATFALMLGASAVPAHAQFFGQTVDNSTVLGGVTGAAIGGAIGSNVAGSGNRDEGTAIGALVGGLAGASIGNARSDYYGNPYAGSLNPGFNGRNLLGTGIGAGLGGVIGSNLAGSGVQEEGTALGALIGGVAGYAIANRSGGGAWNGYGGGYGFDAPAYGGGYAPAPTYVQQGYVQQGYVQPTYVQPTYIQPSYVAPQPTFRGYVNGATYANSTTTYVQPAPVMRPAPAPTYTTTYSAPTTVVQAPRYGSLPVVSSRTSHYYSNGSGVIGGLAHGESVVGYSRGCSAHC